MILAALISLISVAHGADLAGCGATLRANLCYTTPAPHWLEVGSENLAESVKAFQNRKCLPPPVEKFKVITDVYEQLPVEVQRAFCEMKRVYLVSGETSWGAMAEFYFDTKTMKVKSGEWYPTMTATPTGYIMQISEKNRFSKETASFYTSRVFQQRFGVNVMRDGLAKDLPLAEYNTPFGDRGALATTLIHEIGHMLSRAHRVTDIFFLPRTETAWSKLTWSFDGDDFSSKAFDSAMFSRIGQKSLVRSEARAVVSAMKKSGIPTLYAAGQVEEEFAEDVMFTIYDDFKWTLGGEVLLDLRKEVTNNPAFKAKRDFIRKLLASPAAFSLKTYGTISGEVQAL